MEFFHVSLPEHLKKNMFNMSIAICEAASLGRFKWNSAQAPFHEQGHKMLCRSWKRGRSSNICTKMQNKELILLSIAAESGWK